jgi:enterochelin esterase family protein
MRKLVLGAMGMAAALFVALSVAVGQNPFGRPPPEFVSPEVSDDAKITFRLHAPRAEAVRVLGPDLPGNSFTGVEMKALENGVYEATVGPVVPGAFRYQFLVDGLAVIDPRNPSTSESNSNSWSLVYVAGSEVSDAKDVPHGAVAQVRYYSKSLKRLRRMHVYTPPGYESGEGKFPVLYLLHGATDSDASWSSVGRAGFILDNLIAAKKAQPMIVVMPAGHTGPFRFGPPGDRTFEKQVEEFGDDFTSSVRPHVEKHYRVKDGREHRAIAGLSMGGLQTLNVAFANLDQYAYIGVMSSGIFGIVGGPGGVAPDTRWEEDRKAILDDARLKKGLRLLWIGCGKEDFLLDTSNATVKMLGSHGFNVVSELTDGGHTWLVWRDYLARLAPLLFREGS